MFHDIKNYADLVLRSTGRHSTEYEKNAHARVTKHLKRLRVEDALREEIRKRRNVLSAAPNVPSVQAWASEEQEEEKKFQEKNFPEEKNFEPRSAVQVALEAQPPGEIVFDEASGIEGQILSANRAAEDDFQANLRAVQHVAAESGLVEAKRLPKMNTASTAPQRGMSAARAVELALDGMSPVEFMLQILREPPPDGLTPQERLFWETRRLEAAKAAAPYVHPKLAQVEVHAHAEISHEDALDALDG